MSLEHDIRRLRIAIERDVESGRRIDIQELVRQLRRMESAAREVEQDAERFEKKYKRLRRASD